jgi:hypothetical protein
MRLVNSVITKIGTLALVGYMAWSGWANLRPEKPQIGTVRKDLADRVISTIVEDIRSSRGELRQAALLHFGNDPTDYFTNGLRRAIEQTGILDLRDRTISEKVRNLLNLRHPSPQPSPEAVVKYGEHVDVGGVLYGAVHTFESYPSGTKIDVEVDLADIATGRNVFSKRYQVETSPGSSILATVQEKARAFPWFQRLFGWLLAVLLLPVFTVNFTRTMLRRRSNEANAFVLAIYTLADALLAWLLVGAALNSWWTVAAFILAIAAAFAYNVRVMTFALRLET